MKLFGEGISSEVMAPSSSMEWSIGGMLSKGQYGNLLLSDFSMREQEIIDVRKCFEDVSHIYAFGRDPESTVLNIGFLVMLNPRCSSSGGPIEIKAIRQLYEAHRIYKNPKTIHITIGMENMDGYLIGMTMGVADPTSQLLKLGFTFILDEET